jgi:hypothetical protein
MMHQQQSLRKLLDMDKAGDEETQSRCIENAADIVRNHTGRIIIPDELNGIVLQIAALIYQRRLNCCGLNTGAATKTIPRDIISHLDKWRLPANDD